MSEEWGLLTGFLPEGWQELATETRAMVHARGVIRSPDVLLQVLLLHVATGLSLKQAAARARMQGLAKISSVALFKRLRGAEGWLRGLARRMFERSRFSCAGLRVPKGRRLKVKSKSQGLASEARGGRGEALWFSGRAGCFRWPSPQGRQIEARGK